MLILSSKKQESVVIGGCSGFERLLRVTVVEISRSRVKLAFDADVDIPVHRLEVYEQINDPDRADSQTSGSGLPTD